MIGFLISLLVLAIIVGLCWWIIGMLPIPQPIRNVIIVIFLVICLLYLIGMLTGYAAPFPMFRGGYR